MLLVMNFTREERRKFVSFFLFFSELFPLLLGHNRHGVLLAGVKNCKFICAKVQDVIHDVIGGLQGSQDVVAILDPPRPGVGQC
jgi:hypothetical protein